MYRTIPQLLVDAAERAPDKLWLRADDVGAELRRRPPALSAANRPRCCVSAASRAATWSLLTARTTPPYLLAWLAITSLGAIAVPINPAATAAEICRAARAGAAESW